MSTNDLEKLCTQVQQVAREAGAFIRREREQFDVASVEIKGRNNFVTHVDKASERMVVEGLSSLLPGAGFITEEDATRERGTEYDWIIDPLDGTTNFIHGLPCFCVSIGLARNNEPLLGVIYEVNLDECFYAWKGGGAYLNGKQIHVSKTKQLSDALTATGFPYDTGAKREQYLGLFGELLQRARGLRRIGSAATDMAYVACGRFDAFYEYGLNPWDVAAGAVIVQEAGGAVIDFDGGNNFLFGKQLICGTPPVAEELRTIAEKYFK